MKPPPNLSNPETLWIKNAQHGDPDAFESLVHLYEKRVYGLAARLCGNPDDAQEAAQEAFLSAWQGLPSFRGDASFSTWLYRLTNNACIDLLRREKRRRQASGPSLDNENLNLEVFDPSATPQEHVEQEELQKEVACGLKMLSPEHRSVLVLREIQQLSYEEISRVLDLDIGTVKSRISRGRKQLRALLNHHGNFFTAAASKEKEKEGCK